MMSLNGTPTEEKATRIPFYLFMFYILSFFVHLPARIPILGTIHFDLLVIALIFVFIYSVKIQQPENLKLAYYIKMLFGYSVLVLPFTNWPGTVLKLGLPNLVKATIFFYFTYKLILTEQRLKVMVLLFMFVNTFRVFEPLYLHLTEGYWGDATAYGEDQTDRLSGSPYPKDIINPNGLAFVIATVLPFYHYIFGAGDFKRKIIYWGVLPPLLYAMALTLSRSGMLAIFIIYGTVFFKSNKKIVLLTLGIAAALTFFASLNEVQRDRYLSVFSHKTKSSATADGRVSGWLTYLDVAMVKPVFGHGLGASAEANFNYSGRGQPAHNLWLEVLQELGIVGVFIFVFFAYEIYKGFKRASEAVKGQQQPSEFLVRCLSAMQVWLIMNFLFSFASYGLTSYEWYLFAGFSAVMVNLSRGQKLERHLKKNV